ncbi:MAG: hypothetical protein UT48_C0044G0002 [Parcubacteria group bacterium GW2011_GWE2_39_37]|uniref:Uncharacterized protein n=1 Tax=Candidatus Falkowbacteria bacterium GW2011_GWF2_39_8 TaxID=1618642 RepID=A0A0G0Q1B0_9BACT|nr:MAG: hypothetical protein UT48_C0044G0002 [Parcubacteria group bacterium GW2011_GWE2_39_37]KKR33953.1 MAG: hypothetical protein UT64_C0001G0027 [Candidatus Falkowbacteria bacterium GW2011_GWF2_39_8]
MFGNRANNILRSMDSSHGTFPQKASEEEPSEEQRKKDKEKLMGFAVKLVEQSDLVKNIEESIKLIKQATEAVGKKDDKELRSVFERLSQFLGYHRDLNKLIFDFKNGFAKLLVDKNAATPAEEIKKIIIKALSEETGIQYLVIENVFDIKNDSTATLH